MASAALCSGMLWWGMVGVSGSVSEGVVLFAHHMACYQHIGSVAKRP